MTRSEQTLPPALVLGIETQIGLALVRELGRAGIRVIGISRSAHPIAGASKYMERVVRAPERREELIPWLAALGREYSGAVLLALSELDLALLAENREALDGLRLVCPSLAALRATSDKAATLRIASEVGICVPRSVSVAEAGTIEAAVASANYPAVVKWSDPVAVRLALEREGLPLIKAEYAQSPTELTAILSRYSRVGAWPLVQQYCRGVGLGQFFFMKSGEALLRFQHLRVAEWPPEGGVSAVCDALPLSEHGALQELSIELLRRLGWSGVAMVEYRLDPATGETVLMEVNGRFWGSYPLAVHSGAGFGLAAYFVEGLGREAPNVALRDDLRARFVVAEVKRLGRILFAPSQIADPFFHIQRWREIARFVTDFFRPRRRYYVWAWRDPLPLFRDVTSSVLRRNE